MRSTRRLAVLARGIGWGRNTLRRPSDRLGYAARLTALVLAICLVPTAALLGEQSYRHDLAVAHTQAANSRQVTATLLQAGPILVPLGNRPATDVVPGTWTYPAHVHHAGNLTVGEGSAAGSTTRIWVDTKGNQVDAPVTGADARGWGMLTAIIVFVLSLGLLACALVMVEWCLNRGRLRRWENDWRKLDPQWTEPAN